MQLGELLVQERVLTQAQLDSALKQQMQFGGRLGTNLIELGFIDADTLARARAAGADPALALARNDAHGFFAAVGGQVVTGPTLTNVNDIRAILVLPG